jgi:hypothetical protein
MSDIITVKKRLTSLSGFFWCVVSRRGAEPIRDVNQMKGIVYENRIESSDDWFG